MFTRLLQKKRIEMGKSNVKRNFSEDSTATCKGLMNLGFCSTSLMQPVDNNFFNLMNHIQTVSKLKIYLEWKTALELNIEWAYVHV